MRFPGLVKDLAVVIESVLQSHFLKREKNVLKRRVHQIFIFCYMVFLPLPYVQIKNLKEDVCFVRESKIERERER